MSDRDSEIQRHRDSEIQRRGDTEIKRHRDSDGTQVTEEVPPLAACVKTLPEAVQLSLQAGINDTCLFIFARALKAFEITTNRRLRPIEVSGAFAIWWNVAKPQLPPDADFDEWRFDFEATFAKTQAALGANSLQEAIRRTEAGPPPPQAQRYSSPKLRRLVAACYQLQLLQGTSPFFLGVRDAARILGTDNLSQANAMLLGLVRDGILILVEKGTRKRATRFRFHLPETSASGPANALKPAPVITGSAQDKRNPPKSPRNASSAKPLAQRVANSCEPAEPNKAFLERIKGLRQ